MNQKIDEEEFRKELYKEYYKQLKSGDTNMGYEAWKLNSLIHTMPEYDGKEWLKGIIKNDD